MTRLHPSYMEAADQISKKSEGDFISCKWVSEILEQDPKTDEFRFAYMKLTQELLNHHEILLRSTTCDGEKGWRIATDRDKINFFAPRAVRQMFSSLARHRKTLLAVQNPDGLPERERMRLERHMQFNAFLEGSLIQGHRSIMRPKTARLVEPRQDEEQ